MLGKCLQSAQALQVLTTPLNFPIGVVWQISVGGGIYYITTRASLHVLPSRQVPRKSRLRISATITYRLRDRNQSESWGFADYQFKTTSSNLPLPAHPDSTRLHSYLRSWNKTKETTKRPPTPETFIYLQRTSRINKTARLLAFVPWRGQSARPLDLRNEVRSDFPSAIRATMGSM